MVLLIQENHTGSDMTVVVFHQGFRPQPCAGEAYSVAALSDVLQYFVLGGCVKNRRENSV